LILKRSQGTAIGTLPVYTAAGHSPQVLFHAGVTDLKTARTCPAKRLFLAAATAYILLSLAFSFATLFFGHM
jgi:hypothetical protein